MSKFIHTSAGNGGILGGHPTDKFKVNGTDLGFLFEGGKQFAPSGKTSLWVGGVFGDTFSKSDPHAPGGGDWRSPVMGRSSNRDFLSRGIKWDNFAGSPNEGGRAKEIFPYKHSGPHSSFINGNDFDAFTIIPNDIIQVPDGRYFGMGFRVENWVNPKEDVDRLLKSPQSMCWTYSNAWFWSNEPHAEDWQLGRYRDNLGRLYEWPSHDTPGYDNRGKFFQNASFLMLPGDDQLYVFGSREGRKIGAGDQSDGIYLRRTHYNNAFTDTDWEFWGFKDGRWQWGRDVWPTPILKPITPGSWIGELNAQYIGGKVVLTYADSLMGSVAVVADRPDSVWSDPTVLVSRIQSGFQYAPSVHPWSPGLSEAYLHLSSWAQVPNPANVIDRNAPGVLSINYCTQGYNVSLVSASTRPKRSVTMDSEILGLDTTSLSSAEREETIADIVAASAEANPGLGESEVA